MSKRPISAEEIHRAVSDPSGSWVDGTWVERPPSVAEVPPPDWFESVLESYGARRAVAYLVLVAVTWLLLLVLTYAFFQVA